jgi:hypothetical protein
MVGWEIYLEGNGHDIIEILLPGGTEKNNEDLSYDRQCSG